MIWDEFFVLAKLTGTKQRQREKGAHRFNVLDAI